MPHYKTSCSLTHKLTIKRSVLMKPAQTLLHIAKTTSVDTRFHQCRLQRHKRFEIVVKWASNRHTLLSIEAHIRGSGGLYG